MEHTPHERLISRKKQGVHLTKDEHLGFNGWLAVKITNIVGTMWTAYLFTFLALLSLPAILTQGGFVQPHFFPAWIIAASLIALVAWVAQTFIQLVLLPIIMVGQNVSAKASDKQALQTFKDAEAILEITDEVHKLIKINNELTQVIHNELIKPTNKKKVVVK